MNSALALLRKEEHISVSALNTYIRCPKQWQHRYLLKTEASHRASALAFGTAIHKALAAHYEALNDGKEELSHEALSTVFRDSWAFQLDGEVPVLLSDKESVDGLTDTGIKMLEVFLDKAPRYAGVAEVEMPWSIELVDEQTGEALPRLVGVFDAVVRNGDGGYLVLEHKTGARRFSEDRVAYDTQVTVYGLAAKLMGLGEAPVAIQLLTKTKNPAFELYETRRTAADRKDFIEMAVGVTRAIKAGAFYPVRDWPCRGCEYAHRCVAG